VSEGIQYVDVVLDTIRRNENTITVRAVAGGIKTPIPLSMIVNAAKVKVPGGKQTLRIPHYYAQRKGLLPTSDIDGGAA